MAKTENMKNLVFRGHHLIKHHPHLIKNYPNCTTKIFFKIQILIGKLFMGYLVQPQKIQDFKYFNTSF